MKLDFKKKNTVWKNASEGSHTCLIVGHTQPAPVEGMNGETYNAFRFILEVTDEYVDDEKQDKHLTVRTKNMRVDSIHPKSNLFKLAAAAFKSKEFTLENTTDLIGKFVDVVIQHNTTDDGRTFANVESVFPTKKEPANYVSTYDPPEDVMTGEETEDEKQLAKEATKSEKTKEDLEAEKEFGHLFKS